ncbi:MAG: pirin family protein [Ectobacillus sp.]
MITIYPAQSRYSANHGWLQSSFSFSFADYYDPNNMEFGPMRVLNDDFVKPNRGFGMHPHAEMEIVSIVLKGHLQHKDSAGHTATTTWGGIQRMSAGTGIFHSEMNPSPKEDVNFLQMWFFPEVPRLTPSYEQTEYDVKKLKNSLLPVVTKNPTSKDVAHIHQDVTIYLSELERGKELIFKQEQNRRIFMFSIEGEILLNGTDRLGKRDSARITNVHELHIKANEDATFMLIDLP